MQLHSQFSPVALTQVEPEGWLRAFLDRQRHGLTGYLEVAGYPFDSPGWGAPSCTNKGDAVWWPYEQTGYWVDGMVRCGHLLRDPFLLEKANRQLDYVLSHPDKDGYLGPKSIKKPENMNRWAHTVLFRALMARHSATGEKAIPEALRRHYLSGTSPHWFHREITNIEPILWTYEHTGDRRLLEHALNAYDTFNRELSTLQETVKGMLSDAPGDDHGVTYNEMCKLGALIYKYTGDRRCLRATENAYRKIDRDQMLIDGIHSSTERLRGKDPLDSHETCDIADYTWSVGYLLEITGKAEYADKIERACFNAAPGAVRHDFKALQYFSCPNQVICHDTANHNLFHRGMEWMSYRPNPGTECCAGNVHRIMPNYAARMWMRDAKGGVVAALYGPSRVTFRPADSRDEVTIVQDTGYPFTEEIAFRIQCAHPVRFGLTLRIPGWCEGASLAVNGRPLERVLKAGRFETLHREFQPNDRVTLTLPMRLKMSRWPRGGVGIERGPLVYSLAIEENWTPLQVKGRTNKDFPAWALHAASPWNYALALDEDSLERDIEVLQGPLGENPWMLDSAPVELRAPARRVAGWNVVKTNQVDREHHIPGAVIVSRIKGRFELTPNLPDPEDLPGRLSKNIETIRLVPYGCTHLRITIFPQCRP